MLSQALKFGRGKDRLISPRNSPNSLGDTRSPFTIPLVAIFVALGIFGYVNLYSAAIGTDFFWSQVKNSVPAVICFVLCGWVIPLRWFNSYAYWIYGIVSAMLCVVLFTGHIAGGSQRWINLGFMTFQPSEFAKLSIAILVARYFFTSRLQVPYRIRDLWPLLVLVGFVFALVFEQPDLGTAGVCMLIATTQFAFVRLNKGSLTIVGILTAISSVLGWNFLHDYQKLRVINLFNPDFDPSGSGYNSLQSLIAIGNGSTWGRGFMKGTQTQLQFLPARHTDFAFAVFAEEHGFFQSALVFLLFGAFTYLALAIARQSKETFSGMLVIGITANVFIAFFINVAMVLGMFPVVGMPLPLFSLGGSALLTVYASLGLLISVDRQNMRRAGGFQ